MVLGDDHHIASLIPWLASAFPNGLRCCTFCCTNVLPKPPKTPHYQCSTLYRKLLICRDVEDYLANFKTAAFSQLGHSSIDNSNVFRAT